MMPPSAKLKSADRVAASSVKPEPISRVPKASTVTFETTAPDSSSSVPPIWTSVPLAVPPARISVPPAWTVLPLSVPPLRMTALPPNSIRLAMSVPLTETDTACRR